MRRLRSQSGRLAISSMGPRRLESDRAAGIARPEAHARGVGELADGNLQAVTPRRCNPHIHAVFLDGG